jgi:hypothetical protein
MFGTEAELKISMSGKSAASKETRGLISEQLTYGCDTASRMYPPSLMRTVGVRVYFRKRA